MDQSTLVADEIYDGRRFVERFVADGHPVRAAFWAKTVEDGLRFLYVVTDAVDRDGPAAVYRAVHESLRKLGRLSVRSSEIKVVSPQNPLAKDVLAVLTHHPERLHSPWGALGSVAVEETYIYPPHVSNTGRANSMTTEDLGRELVRLMNRGPGTHQPSHVALKDGSSFDGVPFSLDVGSQGGMMARFIADGETAPRIVRLDEIDSIA